MSNTNQDTPIRLVRLTEAASEAHLQSRILTLAAEGKIRLSIPTPLGKVPYAGSARIDMSIRTTPTMERRVREARRQGIPVITNPAPCREVDFLILTPKDARQLLVAKSAHPRYFLGGLKHASDDIGALAFVLGPLCLCPEGAAVDRQPLILAATDYAIKVDVQDVFLSKHDADLAATPDSVFEPWMPPFAASAPRPHAEDERHSLDEPREPMPEEDNDLTLEEILGLEKEDPSFQFKKSAPAVYVLYAAAKHFFGPTPPETVSQNALKAWLRDKTNPIYKWAEGHSKSYDKLLTEANTQLAFKLINIDHNPNQGNREGYSEATLNGERLHDAAKYKFGAHVSERLSLVALVAEKWESIVRSATPSDTGKATADPDDNGPAARLKRSKLRPDQCIALTKELQDMLPRWGFLAEGELNAIVDFVIWPIRLVELRRENKK